MTRLVVVFTLAAVAATAAAPARTIADVEDDRALARAKKLHKDGEKLFALGKFARALEKYEQAFEAKPIPAFLFNIGQCHRNLGDYDSAIFSFNKYLALAPDAKNRGAVLDYIAELEREQQKDSASDLDLVKPDPDPETPREVGPGRRPIYKKWWFWGGVAAVSATVGTVVILSSGGGPPSTDLGNIDFGR